MHGAGYYDVIVIGTGCGGAAAGALAAYYGHRTLILEKNSMVGGRAATFEKDGYKMDHGHVLLRCDRGPHGKLLKMVKCRDLIPEFSYAADWGIKPICDTAVIDIPPNHSRFAMPFMVLRQSGFRFTFKDFLQCNALALFALCMPKRQLKKYDQMDLNTFLSKFSHNQFLRLYLGSMVTVMMGGTLEEVSAGELMRILKASILDFMRTGYPVTGEGIAAIPKSFLKAAQRYGAKVELNAPVDRIVVENNRVKGVMAGGRFIEAGIIISNAGIGETVFKLVGPEHFDPAYSERIRNLKYSFAGLSLKYILDEPITEYAWGGEVPGDFDAIAADMTQGRVPRRLPWMFVSTTNIDKTLAPEGRQLISVISGGSAVEPGALDWQEWMDKVKSQVDEYFPRLKEHTLCCYEATPDDIARYTGRRYGDAVGVAQIAGQVGDLRPSPVSPIHGLYYAGADVGRDNIATELATQSAIALAPYLRKGRKRGMRSCV